MVNFGLLIGKLKNQWSGAKLVYTAEWFSQTSNFTPVCISLLKCINECQPKKKLEVIM